MLDRSLGLENRASAEMFAGDYQVDPNVVSDYSVPIEDIIVKTMEKEGMNSHDVGLGWHRSLRRMNSMQAMGIDIPAMQRRDLPERKLSAKVDIYQVKKVLSRSLRDINPTIIAEGGDGPMQVVVEIL
ncbi:MAG: hypothetical protein DRP08_04545 [Candidatus Aenigmatarchaeota archaeon]|nr:MAG: hypothetical protein DRP08_04545 [Candidatus Aenigmarchaeota archaeon]